MFESNADQARLRIDFYHAFQGGQLGVQHGREAAYELRCPPRRQTQFRRQLFSLGRSRVHGHQSGCPAGEVEPVDLPFEQRLNPGGEKIGSLNGLRIDLFRVLGAQPDR